MRAAMRGKKRNSVLTQSPAAKENVEKRRADGPELSVMSFWFSYCHQKRIIV